MSASLTPGSIIVVKVTRNGDATINTPSDTAGNTYADCGAGSVYQTSSTTLLQVFYCYNTHTTASNVVSVVNTNARASTITAVEYTGNAPSGAVDSFASTNNATSGAGGGQNLSVGPMSPSTNGEMIVAFCTQAAGTLTVGTNFTGYSTETIHKGEWLSQRVKASVSATWNDATNNDAYCAIAVALAPAAVQGNVLVY
jgi:hypothetical protein